MPLPIRLVPRSLVSISSNAVASLLLKGCMCMCKKQLLLCPGKSSDRNADREEFHLKLSPAHRSLFDWLCNLPNSVVQDVVVHLLDLLAKVDVFLEKKKLKEDFLSYLLYIIKGFKLESLKFSYRLTGFWKIHSLKLVEDSLCSSFPGLVSLTSLNISQVASDRMVYIISKYLPSLISLELHESQVTDRGLGYLAGVSSVTFTGSLNIPLVAEPNHDFKLKQEGCLKLRHINLGCCEFISETGLRFLIKHMNSLQSGGFQGMGMNPLSEDMMFQLTMFTPHLTTITLDTKDEALCLLAMCPNLTSINVELKDCLGIGFIQFLEQRGSQLVEVDVTYIDVEEGLDVQQGQFFNLAIVSVGQLAMNLRKLSLWGSGPVSSDAVRKMELEDKIGQYCPMNHNGYQDQCVAGNYRWMRRMADSWFSSLETLRLICHDYDSDFDHTVIPICPELLKSVLMAAKKLSALDLEWNFFEPLTDAYICEIVSVNPLISLSTMFIGNEEEDSCVPFTVSTVQLLLSKCDCLNQLDITNWNVTRQQFEEMKRIVKKNNWDLVIFGRVGWSN